MALASLSELTVLDPHPSREHPACPCDSPHSGRASQVLVQLELSLTLHYFLLLICLSNTVVVLQFHVPLVRLSHCYDRIPDRHILKKEGFIFVSCFQEIPIHRDVTGIASKACAMGQSHFGDKEAEGDQILTQAITLKILKTVSQWLASFQLGPMSQWFCRHALFTLPLC